MVFQLLQTYLKLEASSPNDLDACFRARMDFKCYVIGMSLAKLHAQVEERDWAVKKYEKDSVNSWKARLMSTNSMSRRRI